MLRGGALDIEGNDHIEEVEEGDESDEYQYKDGEETELEKYLRDIHET